MKGEFAFVSSESVAVKRSQQIERSRPLIGSEIWVTTSGGSQPNSVED